MLSSFCDKQHKQHMRHDLLTCIGPVAEKGNSGDPTERGRIVRFQGVGKGEERREEKRGISVKNRVEIRKTRRQMIREGRETRQRRKEQIKSGG